MAQNLVDWLRAEAPDRQVYERPPLALALCQVRFAPRYGFDDARVAPFQEAIESRYPNPAKQQTAAIQVIGTSEPIEVQAQPSGPRWQFTDEMGDWTVTLTNEFVALETRAYAHFDDFLKRLRWVLQTLVKTIKPGRGRRVGLRYINEIRSVEKDWSGMIRPNVLGPLAIDAFRDNCDQALQVLLLRAGEAKITLQHGPFPTGSTVVPKPGTPTGSEPFYLLDIDMYREFNPPESLKMDASVICQHVDGYHATVAQLFRWATTNEYRESLGERGDVH